ncbi:MAG: hypothetical protein IPK34_09535 [Ramlibacter sp.]|nr:hypothetical protein [Ramlibacter sp.]
MQAFGRARTDGVAESSAGEAFGYALSNWVALNTFVEHGILRPTTTGANAP